VQFFNNPLSQTFAILNTAAAASPNKKKKPKTHTHTFSLSLSLSLSFIFSYPILLQIGQVLQNYTAKLEINLKRKHNLGCSKHKLEVVSCQLHFFFFAKSQFD
jgi:hypothetical protein